MAAIDLYTRWQASHGLAASDIVCFGGRGTRPDVYWNGVMIIRRAAFPPDFRKALERPPADVTASGND